MKKAYTYFILSLMILILGIIFTISGVLLQTLPLSSKSALLVFSTAFIIIGAVSSAVHYKKYYSIQKLLLPGTTIVARFTYPPNSSNLLKTFIKDQKSSTLATALLILILALIFSLIFAYSGGTYILYLGYTLAALSFFTFIIAHRFITAYYKHLETSEIEAVFGEDAIYFLDEYYPLSKTFYELTKISLFLGTEPCLIFEYNVPDVDDPYAYHITIPVPADKTRVAIYLKNYYADFINVQ